MSDKIDDWHKLATYDTNIQSELHANLLRNNNIRVSLQTLSAIPGMNSGAVLWVQQSDLNTAKRILEGIDVNQNEHQAQDGIENQSLNRNSEDSNSVNTKATMGDGAFNRPDGEL